MPLHTAYRPADTDLVVGNRTACATIEGLLKRDASDRPHSLLFVGPSGCGKTTMARIFAHGLGAYDSDKRAVENPDYVELNAADFKGIEMVRSVRRQMMLRPVAGPVRVWLLDECHKLTADAQEALLKCLEEPPTHVYFLLATTEPEKLKVTLRRRCTTIQLEAVSEEELVALMREVIEVECEEGAQIKVADSVLEQIAFEAQGSPGIALNVLDRIAHLSPKQQREEADKAAAEQNEAIALCRELCKPKPHWTTVVSILRDLRNVDAERTRRAVLGYATSVLLNSKRRNEQAYVVLDVFAENVYDSGFAGIVRHCYTACFAD